MSLYRVILQGRLEFGSERSFAKAKKMYSYRLENYCKSDAIFKEADEIFIEDENALVIPRYVGQSYEKTFKNTTSLLQYCSQFAMMGVIKAWQTDSGKVINYSDIEPESDKVAVMYFQRGKQLSKQQGSEFEAIQQLDKAIDKYNRHAQAYERRGNINFTLKKYSDANRDYRKAMKIDNTNPMPYYGIAKVNIVNKEYDLAIENLDTTCKKSLALQPIYWKARRLKADCHFKLGQYDKAEFDLKLFTKRKFKQSDPNFLWRRHAFYYYGRVLIQLERYKEAIDAIEYALELKVGIDNIPLEDIYFFLGQAKLKAGKNGYINDLKKASELGKKEAKMMLQSVR